jgi:hypothetical protein
MVIELEIQASMRKEIENEFKYVSDKIIAEKDTRRKAFFYSAAYGVIRRIVNLQYDPQLSLMELILETSYNTINDRVNRIVVGNDVTVPLIDGFFEKLAQAINDLADCVKSDKDTYKILEHIVVLTHTTTGNGYYLYTKGDIKV